MIDAQKPESLIFDRTHAAARILVVDLGFLGDTLHLVPALWVIRQNYPKANLSVLSGPLGSEVLRLVPCVDRILTVELHPERRSAKDHLGVLKGIRAEKFDLAFTFGGGDRALFLTALSGARTKVAHAAGRSHFWNKWIIPHWVPKQPEDMPVYEQRRGVLKACGLKLSTPSFQLEIPKAAEEWAKSNIPAGALHLSLNSANPLKEWPLRHYVTLVQQLLSEIPSLNVVVSIGRASRECERLKQFESQLKHPAVKSLPPGLELGQLAATLKRCRAHFGPDSGVMHLAQALGVPSLSLFRNQPGFKSWLPDQPNQRYLVADCKCIDHRSCPCEQAGEAACLAVLDPAAVFDELKRLLGSMN